jgi:repressor of nif and glnA expression
MIDEMHYGLVTMHILHHGQDDQLTAGWMADELQEHGYEYDEEEVEHALRNLVAKGLLDTDEEEYWTTDDGNDFLQEMKDRAAEVAGEVL